MRTSDVYTLVAALVLCAAPVTLADVVNVFWEPNGTSRDLFASVTADTIVYNADLGDETINLPPNGVNTGLFSTDGEILEGSFVTLGGEPVEFPRPFTISPSGSGSHADASWYKIDGVGPEFDPDTGYRVWLGRFFIEDGTALGGESGGPNEDIQSRVYVGWGDDMGVGVGVFNIPLALVCVPILYVDASAPPDGDGLSWETALNDLQAALVAAVACEGAVSETWVAAGTYTPAPPDGDRAVSFQVADGLAMYGGFPPGGGDFDERDPLAFPTILSGDLNGDDGPDFTNNGENSYHVVTAVNIGIAQNTILDGFTITAGNATGRDEFSGGGGLRVYASNLQLSNCWLVANTAVRGGACDILEGSSLELTGCTVTENAAERGGGVALGGSEIYVVNCLFVGNVATVLAGAIGGGSSTFTLINCTISDNTAPDVGGLRIQGAGSQATVSNCVLWDNGGPAESDQIGLVGGGQLTVGYSCIQGWTGQYGGEGNIDADPLFVDSDNDDYHLSAGSPCIDAADNTAVPKGIDTDLDGNPRFVDDADTKDTGNGDPPIVDMGAYEFQPVLCPWDLDGNGTVGATDLLSLLVTWGPCDDCDDCPADFDHNCTVGATDLLALLVNWGPCP